MNGVAVQESQLGIVWGETHTMLCVGVGGCVCECVCVCVDGDLKFCVIVVLTPTNKCTD